MKKKVMQRIFILLFVVGIVVGYLLPGDLRAVEKKFNEKPLQPGFYDVAKRMGQLDSENDYFKYSVLTQIDTASAELLRIDATVPPHKNMAENRFVYVYRGRAKVTLAGVTEEISPGMLVVIPAGVENRIERVGDDPVEAVVFSSPTFSPAVELPK